MSIAPSPISAERFAEMTFDVPVELVRGEIVEMTPPDLVHGQVCGNVVFLLKSLLRDVGRRGCVAGNDSGIVTERDPDTVRGADVALVFDDRLPEGRIPRGYTDLIPNLCVEVLSRWDRWRDVHRKIDEYLERGVSQVWIVDPQRRTLQVFRADEPPATYAESEEFRDDPLLPGFACRVADLFEGL